MTGMGGQYHPNIHADLKDFFVENNIPFRIIDKKKYGFSANFPDFEIIEEDDNRSSADLTDDVVRISTFHQAKGTDAKYVAIIGFENIEKGDSEVEKKAALGYVGLTRAKEKCFIYYRDKNNAVEILEELLESF